MNWILTIVVCLTFTNSFSQKEDILVDAQSEHIQYEGRININNTGGAEIYWPGSSCKITFSGTELKAILKDERGHNYYNVIIDGDSVRVLKLDTVKKTYTLASGLEPRQHTVELFRRTDWFNGITCGNADGYRSTFLCKPMAIKSGKSKISGFYQRN